MRSTLGYRGAVFVPVFLLLPAVATNACRITANKGTICIVARRGRYVGVTGWLLVWLIVNALIVAWRILVVSIKMEARDRSVHGEAGLEYVTAPARGDVVVETPRVTMKRASGSSRR